MQGILVVSSLFDSPNLTKNPFRKIQQNSYDLKEEFLKLFSECLKYFKPICEIKMQ